MKQPITNSKKGFTIIEVVLVLAIGGLIMMMVFIALPALQRSQRDTQRRQDMSRLITAMQNYSSLHAGRTFTVVTGNDNELFNDYLKSNGDTFVDPSGDEYYIANVVDCKSAKKTTTDDGAETVDKPAETCPDPSTVDDLEDTGNTGGKFRSGAIFAYQYASCQEDKPVYKNSKGSYAFTIKLEGAGTICLNN